MFPIPPTPGFVLSDLFNLETTQKMRLRVEITELACNCCDADEFLKRLSSILIRYQLLLPIQTLFPNLSPTPPLSDEELEDSEL